MIRILCLILLAVSINHLTHGQITLNIVIKNLKNSTGSIAFNFLDKNDKSLKELTQTISNKECTIEIMNLKPGKYAFKYFHDENNNKKLDTNLIGIPKEGYGFSNDVKGTFGPPVFEDTIFEINKDTTFTNIAYYIIY
jgi:uncharacterized protein (DUF2141 family)